LIEGDDLILRIMRREENVTQTLPGKSNRLQVDSNPFRVRDGVGDRLSDRAVA
jgi:hypothetical protein